MHDLQPHDLMIHWTMAGSASSSGRSSLRSSVSSTASFLSPLATRSYSPSTLQPLSSDLPQHLGTQAACASGSPGPPPAPIPAAPVNELAHSAASLFIYFWRDQSPLGSLLPESHGQTLTPSMPVHASHSIPLSLREQPPVFLDCGRMTRAAVLQQDLDLGAFLTRVLATMQFCQSVIVLALLFVQKASRKRHARVFPVLSEWEVAVAGLMMANKMCDDSTYPAKTWAEVTGFPRDTLIYAEKTLLECLDYRLFVPVEEFQGGERLLCGLGLATHQRRQSSAPVRADTLPSPRVYASMPRRNLSRLSLSPSTKLSHKADPHSPIHQRLLQPPSYSRKRSMPNIAPPDFATENASQRRRGNGRAPLPVGVPQQNLVSPQLPLGYSSTAHILVRPSPQTYAPQQYQQLYYYDLASGRRHGVQHVLTVPQDLLPSSNPIHHFQNPQHYPSNQQWHPSTRPSSQLDDIELSTFAKVGAPAVPPSQFIPSASTAHLYIPSVSSAASSPARPFFR